MEGMIGLSSIIKNILTILQSILKLQLKKKFNKVIIHFQSIKIYPRLRLINYMYFKTISNNNLKHNQTILKYKTVFTWNHFELLQYLVSKNLFTWLFLLIVSCLSMSSKGRLTGVTVIFFERIFALKIDSSIFSIAIALDIFSFVWIKFPWSFYLWIKRHWIFMF